MEEITIPKVLEFDWDEGNSTKSWVKHRVSVPEQEQTFFDKHKRAFIDIKHSEPEEKRFLLFAKTKKGRKLIIAFTIRIIDKKQKIRPVSARPMNRKEARIYEETT